MKGFGKKGELDKEKGFPGKKNSKRIRIPLILSLTAGLLLVFSAASSSRAALTYYSENYSAEFQMFDIGVTLLENGREVSWRNYTRKDDEWQEGGGELLSNLLGEGNEGRVQPGKAYEEKLSVRNSGSIDEYVRVIIYRYWEDMDGKRVTGVSPELIDLGLTGGGWIEDASAGTEERMVLYYTGIVLAGQQTPVLSETLTIKEEAAMVLQEYKGLRFVLEAEVNAVQTHNAADAIKSAWGVDVSVGADGSLSLK